MKINIAKNPFANVEKIDIYIAMVYHFLKYALFPMSESNIFVNHQPSVSVQDFILLMIMEKLGIGYLTEHNDVSE
jgi:hypothetical protein